MKKKGFKKKEQGEEQRRKVKQIRKNGENLGRKMYTTEIGEYLLKNKFERELD